MTNQAAPEEKPWVTAKIRMTLAEYGRMRNNGPYVPKMMTMTKYLGEPIDEDQIPEIIAAARHQLQLPAAPEDHTAHRRWPPQTTMDFLDLAARNWTPGNGERPGSWDGTDEDAEGALTLAGGKGA